MQEQPIDYAVPKRKEEDEERGREGAKVSRAAIGNSIARPLLAMRLSGPQVVHAAAGHGRSSNSGGSGGSGSGNTSSGGGGNSGGGSSSSSSSNSGGSGGYCGGGAATGGGGGGGGAVGGGAGGGMNPGGNGGRGNYGPSSPPTGSLPPFYESLKGGNNLANFANQYNTTQGIVFIVGFIWKRIVRVINRILEIYFVNILTVAQFFKNIFYSIVVYVYSFKAGMTSFDPINWSEEKRSKLIEL